MKFPCQTTDMKTGGEKKNLFSACFVLLKNGWKESAALHGHQLLSLSVLKDFTCISYTLSNA
jgi:hypothetical protein